MMKKFFPLMMASALLLASCAPKYTSATAKPASELSCAEMQDELTKLAGIRAQAESKKGFSKENVLWALFFWPGAVVNEMDNRDVLEKVDTRTAEITKAQSAKGCVAPASVTPPPPATAPVTPPTK